MAVSTGTPATAQHPAQGGRAAAAAHHHRHPRPRHAVEQVGGAQPAGDVRRLLGGGAQQVRLDLPAGPGRLDPAVGGRRPPPRSCAATRAAARRAPRRRTGTTWTAARVGGVGPGGDEQPRVGAAEGLGGGVGVAEQHEVDPAAGDDHLQQPQAGRGELLGVVDDDEPQPGRAAGRARRGRPRGGRRRRRGSRRGRRPRGREGGDLVVLAQHVGGRDPLGAVVRPAEPGEVLGVEAELDGPHQQVAQLAAEGAGGQREVHRRRPRRRRRLPRRVPGEQLAQDDVLLGAAEQPRRRVAAQRRRLAQDAEPERLVGAGQRLGGGAAEPGGDGVAQPGGREPGRRQQQAAVGARPRRARPGRPPPRRPRWSCPCPGRRAPAAPAPRCVDDRMLARVEHRDVAARREHGAGSAQDCTHARRIPTTVRHRAVDAPPAAIDRRSPLSDQRRRPAPRGCGPYGPPVDARRTRHHRPTRRGPWADHRRPRRRRMPPSTSTASTALVPRSRSTALGRRGHARLQWTSARAPGATASATGRRPDARRSPPRAARRSRAAPRPPARPPRARRAAAPHRRRASRRRAGPSARARRARPGDGGGPGVGVPAPAGTPVAHPSGG